MKKENIFQIKKHHCEISDRALNRFMHHKNHFNNLIDFFRVRILYQGQFLSFEQVGVLIGNVGGWFYPEQTIAMVLSMTLQLYRQIFQYRCCYDYYD